MNDRFCPQCGVSLESLATSTPVGSRQQATVEKRSEPTVGPLTAALLILLLGLPVFSAAWYLGAGETEPGVIFFVIVGAGGDGLLAVLAVVGIVAYYYYGGRDTLFPWGWGPLVAIVAGAIALLNNALYYIGEAPQNVIIFVNVLVLALASLEYSKERGSLKTQFEPEDLWFGRGRVSFGVRQRVDELNAWTRTTQKRIGRDLTILLVALPVIFFEPEVVQALNQASQSQLIVVPDSAYVLFAIFFFVLAWRVRSSLRKSRFAIIDINRPHAAAAGQTMLEGERLQLVAFLLIYLVAAGFLIVQVLGNLGNVGSQGIKFVSFSFLYLLSALLCFLVGSWAYKGSALNEIHLTEPSAVDQLGESMGVAPVKVQKGESHSLLMDFDIVGRASTNGGVRSPRYYEAELNATGVDVGADKQQVLGGPPSTLAAMWNCLFREVGNQALHIVLDAVTPQEPNTNVPAKRGPLFAYSHNVQVESALTASKENVLGLASICVTTVDILVGIGTFLLPINSIGLVGIIVTTIAILVGIGTLRSSIHL